MIFTDHFHEQVVREAQRRRRLLANGTVVRAITWAVQQRWSLVDEGDKGGSVARLLDDDQLPKLARQRVGSVWLSLLVPILLEIVVKIVIELWWNSRKEQSGC